MMARKLKRYSNILLVASFVYNIAYIEAGAASLADIITAGANAINAGVSFNSAIDAMRRRFAVTCAIEVENWSKFTLSDGTAINNGGEIQVPPHVITPGKKEVMVTHKSPGGATGTYGTVSWTIGQRNRLLVVMWSIPYDSNLYSNWVGVGLTDVGVTQHPEGSTWFDQMYNGNDGNGLQFTRGEASYNIDPIEYEDYEFYVKATITNVRQASIKVKFIPKDTANLSPSIKKLLPSEQAKRLIIDESDARDSNESTRALLKIQRRDFGISAGTAAIISAASSAIGAGASFTSAVANGDFYVKGDIELENWSKFPLTFVAVRINSGVVTLQASDVLPSKKEIMRVRKTDGTATGSSGVVAWKIGNEDRLVAVMWSIPYDHNLYSNWLAVGITDSGVTSVPAGSDWFDKMYHEESGRGLNFARRSYYDSVRPVVYANNNYEVIGTFSTSRHGHAKIRFIPKNRANFADPVKALLANKK